MYASNVYSHPPPRHFSYLTPVISVIDYYSKQVDSSRKEAELDGVRVPTTLEEYCQLCKPKTQSQSSYDVEDDLLTTDGYYEESSADESTASEHTCSDFEEDSGMA